jgi:transcriptional regulator GlxA family with amidase domain
MSLPKIALVLYPQFSPFHISVPWMAFSTACLPEKPLFEMLLLSHDGKPALAERAMQVTPDGGLERLDEVDMVIVPGWHDLNEPPSAELAAGLRRAYTRGASVVGLCYGAYALAYVGLLDGKRASTHWMAEEDFCQRFPLVELDTNALYVDADGLVTSAGTAAGLDCCLHLIRHFYGAETANRVARVMVVPPHREGGQAQFIEQPVAISTEDARINQLLDYLRRHLHETHRIDDLAARTAMSRRSFTRHFQRATGVSVIQWLLNERLRLSMELLEGSHLSVEKIAETVGFQTATSLRQHFRARYRVSPSVWRKNFGKPESRE